MRKTLRYALLGLALAASPALADQSSFAAMDANQDGSLTPQEHADAARGMFTTMDTNRDGTVTAEEMDVAHFKITGRPAAVNEPSAAEKIKVVDGNGDGMLSAAEHASGSQAMFEKMDADRNGSLSKSEFDAGHARMLTKQ